MTDWSYRDIEAGGGYKYDDALRTYDTAGVMYDYEDAPTVWTFTNK